MINLLSFKFFGIFPPNPNSINNDIRSIEFKRLNQSLLDSSVAFDRVTLKTNETFQIYLNSLYRIINKTIESINKNNNNLYYLDEVLVGKVNGKNDIEFVNGNFDDISEKAADLQAIGYTLRTIDPSKNFKIEGYNGVVYELKMDYICLLNVLIFQRNNPISIWSPKNNNYNLIQDWEGNCDDDGIDDYNNEDDENYHENNDDDDNWNWLIP